MLENYEIYIRNIYIKFRALILLITKKINLHGMLRKIFCDKWYVRALKLEKNLADKGWTYIGSGKDRRVWKRGNVVLKLAFNESGVIANNNERTIYRGSIGKKQDVKYAPCRMVCPGVLMMRAVKEIDFYGISNENIQIPDWAYELKDGIQIGIDHNGTIMVYDYADEIGGIDGNQL